VQSEIQQLGQFEHRVRRRRVRYVVTTVFFLIMVAVYPSHSIARDMKELHRILVPVEDTSKAQRARGASIALSQVLIRLTGDRRVIKMGGVEPLLGKAGDFLIRYRYEQNGGRDQLLLDAEFDEQALGRELKKFNIPVWAKERPDTLAWVVIEDVTGRYLVGLNSESDRVKDVMLAQADTRGIPLLFPTMDLKESGQLVSPKDWDSLANVVSVQSMRYNAPSVLIGYVRQTVPTFWDVRWEIRVGEESFSWRTEGDIVDLVVEDGVDALGDALARRYAVVALSSISDKFALTVLGVKNSGDYTRLLNYLGSLDAVTSLFVRSVDIQSVLIEVSIEGGRSSLAQGISFGSVLAPVEVPPDAYQLLP